MDARSIVDEIISLYVEHGAREYAGEEVSQLEHMLQCANLARSQGANNELVVAAFLHDIGHLLEHSSFSNALETMGEWGVKSHEVVGAKYLSSKGFPKEIVKLVESHVAAKRYLTFADSDYYNKLSEASKQTLQFQGGPMSEFEATAFEKDPQHKSYINLRLWDENAKSAKSSLSDLDIYEEMLFECLREKLTA